MTESERINFLIRAMENGNGAAFAKKIGVSTAMVSRIRNGEVGIRLRVNDILREYPAVNREWLETGVGYPGDLTVDLVKAHYEDKIKRNENLIDYLMNRVKELESMTKA